MSTGAEWLRERRKDPEFKEKERQYQLLYAATPRAKRLHLASSKRTYRRRKAQEQSQYKATAPKGDERKVIMNSEMFFYKEKAPFAKSGKSLAGAVEYYPDLDLMRCHECGCWVKSLAHHVGRHHMPVHEYKRKHKLKMTSSLVSESTRGKMIAAAQKRLAAGGGFQPSNLFGAQANKYKARTSSRPLEVRNSRRECKLQVIEDLIKLADRLKHSPTDKELKANRISKAALEFHFGSANTAYQVAGLERNRGAGPGIRMYSREELVSFIRKVYQSKGRAPNRSDMRRRLLPTEKPYYRVFGTWKAALQEALGSHYQA
jgi:hypothetical protein